MEERRDEPDVVASSDEKVVRCNGAAIHRDGTVVIGKHNLIRANNCIVQGDENIVIGMCCLVNGNLNNISGSFNTVVGQKNFVSGIGAFVSGAENCLQIPSLTSIASDVKNHFLSLPTASVPFCFRHVHTSPMYRREAILADPMRFQQLVTQLVAASVQFSHGLSRIALHDSLLRESGDAPEGDMRIWNCGENNIALSAPPMTLPQILHNFSHQAPQRGPSLTWDARGHRLRFNQPGSEPRDMGAVQVRPAQEPEPPLDEIEDPNDLDNEVRDIRASVMRDTGNSGAPPSAYLPGMAALIRARTRRVTPNRARDAMSSPERPRRPGRIRTTANPAPVQRVNRRLRLSSAQPDIPDTQETGVFVPDSDSELSVAWPTRERRVISDVSLEEVVASGLFPALPPPCDADNVDLPEDVDVQNDAVCRACLARPNGLLFGCGGDAKHGACYHCTVGLFKTAVFNGEGSAVCTLCRVPIAELTRPEGFCSGEQ